MFFLAEGHVGSGVDSEARERVETTLRNLKEQHGYCDKCAKEAVLLLLHKRYA